MSDEFGYSSVDGLVGDVKPPDNLVSVKSRKWWYQEVIGKHGLFPCYGVFLALPSDDQVIEYFTKYTNEINLITGKNCLLIALTKHRIRVWGDNEKFWKGVVDEHIGEGYNIEFAKLFNIDFVQFPCLLIFENTNSDEYFLVPLENNSVKQISEKLREVFSVIDNAVKNKITPLVELKKYQSKKTISGNSKNMLGQLYTLAGSTLETLMKTWVETYLK
jgi:hypothetical protein